MSEELQLFKLITNPDEQDEDFSYIDEFGWVNDEFYIWINYWHLGKFINKLREIFGYGIFDDGGFDGNIQEYGVCINLVDALDGYVDLEEVFPKDKYQH